MSTDSSAQNSGQAPNPLEPRKYTSYARLAYSHPERGTAFKNVLRHTSLLGSAPDCHVRLMSPDILPAHCVITLDGDVLRVRNLHQMPGTWVNGHEVQVSRLSHGDTLQIGPFIFRVETNLTFELSRTALIGDTRIELPAEKAVPPPPPPPATPAPPPEEPAAKKEKEGLSLEFLKSLMLQGLLTRFQADWLLTGEFVEFSIDRYKVERILGTGGMGWLYVARDEESGEKVALKVISTHQDKEYLTRFKLEARAGLKLKHPHIVRTDRIDEADELLFVVMELVEGISLQELIILKKKIAWEQACSFILQAAAGLQHAHEKGMVHRDVKPANLLVQNDGRVKVLDFGLALIQKDEDEFMLAMIAGQDCVGTADYIAPEQTVDSFTVDPRADIYSLGCTLYSTLTGMVPFPAETVALKLKAHRTTDPRPIGDFCNDVPEEVSQIVRKMMSRNPDKRFSSAAEVVKALTPHARRAPAEFDFEQVLKSRVREAKQRIAALQQRRE